MSKRDIGEFKISGFVVGIGLSLIFASTLYYGLSSKIEPPKRPEVSATVDFLLKRAEKLEEQAAADRYRIEQLQKEVEILKASRGPGGPRQRKLEEHSQ